jgi:hypothetical protein
VLIDNFLLVEQGRFREKETVALLTSGRYPARNVQQNIADLRAQIAANEKGAQELRRIVAEFGQDVVEAYMGHVQDNAAEAVQRFSDPGRGPIELVQIRRSFLLESRTDGSEGSVDAQPHAPRAPGSDPSRAMYTLSTSSLSWCFESSASARLVSISALLSLPGFPLHLPSIGTGSSARWTPPYGIGKFSNILPMARSI